MDLIFAYLAGLLTLINPCVLPVLPIVLATALHAGRAGPLHLVAGMSLSFVTLGLSVAAVGYGLGLTDTSVSRAAAVLMVGFGLILMVPRLSAGFATATAGIAARAGAGIGSGAGNSQFLGGLLLGAVWSPCIGPTLGGAIALAVQGQSLLWAGAVMTAFALGTATVMLGLGYGARALILRRQTALRRLARVSRPLLGAVFLATGLAVLFRLTHLVEGWAIQILPVWLTDFSVRF
jgi:cytochrome c biogenesis protein CcdA